MNALSVAVASVLLLVLAYVFMECMLAHEEGSFTLILKYLALALLCMGISIVLPFPYALILVLLCICFFLYMTYYKETDGRLSLGILLLLVLVVLVFHSSLLHIISTLLSVQVEVVSFASVLCFYSELQMFVPSIIQHRQKQCELPSFPVYSFFTLILWMLLCGNLDASIPWLLLYFCGLLMLCILMKQSLRLELQSKRVLQEHLIQLQSKENKERYAWLLQENQYMARTIHDMKKHVLLLDTYMKSHEDESLAQYRHEVAKQADEMLDCIRYGNPMVDRIIGIYAEKLKKAGISLNVELDDVDMSFIEPVDFSAVLMNMLDNAWESCHKAKEKFILLKIKEVSSQIIVLKMKNSCDFIKDKDGKLVTSKNDTLYHGFGLKNMEQIAQKYHGGLRTAYDEQHHIFTTTIRFEDRE